MFFETTAAASVGGSDDVVDFSSISITEFLPLDIMNTEEKVWVAWAQTQKILVEIFDIVRLHYPNLKLCITRPADERLGLDVSCTCCHSAFLFLKLLLLETQDAELPELLQAFSARMLSDFTRANDLPTLAELRSAPDDVLWRFDAGRGCALIKFVSTIKTSASTGLDVLLCFFFSWQRSDGFCAKHRGSLILTKLSRTCTSM